MENFYFHFVDKRSSVHSRMSNIHDEGDSEKLHLSNVNDIPKQRDWNFFQVHKGALTYEIFKIALQSRAEREHAVKKSIMCRDSERERWSASDPNSTSICDFLIKAFFCSLPLFYISAMLGCSILQQRASKHTKYRWGRDGRKRGRRRRWNFEKLCFRKWICFYMHSNEKRVERFSPNRKEIFVKVLWTCCCCWYTGKRVNERDETFPENFHALSCFSIHQLN